MNSAISAFQPMTKPALQRALSTTALGRAIHVLDETSSTNSIAADLAQQGAPHGAVVIAEAQSVGRGRLGRPWHSPHGKNLYCSILLRPTQLPDHAASFLSWIPLLSAAAVARTIQVMAALRPSLKWPNDVLIVHRKIAGLLCESSGVGTPNACVIVGIGLNINERADEFPIDLRDQVTSMAIEAGRPFDRTAVLAALLSELEIRYELLVSGKPADVIDEYRMRCATIGQQVRIALGGDEVIDGLAHSIAADGSLRILRDRQTEGSRENFVDIRAGDVVHVR